MSSLPSVGRILRTPESRFAGLTDFPWTPHYREVGGLRIACIDEGPRDAPVVLLMHGEPTWSFLYRKMIPVLLAAGHRVIAPDLVGFGRSDKPTRAADYSYHHHVLWMTAWMESLDLQKMTLFCQDWGSLIGLRMAAAAPQRFDRIVLHSSQPPLGYGAPALTLQGTLHVVLLHGAYPSLDRSISIPPFTFVSSDAPGTVAARALSAALEQLHGDLATRLAEAR